MRIPLVFVPFVGLVRLVCARCKRHYEAGHVC